ncbi:MAG: hypothetical protein ACYTBJ_22515 [Planctomycetota bacterium]|jgi:hypothetical protein
MTDTSCGNPKGQGSMARDGEDKWKAIERLERRVKKLEARVLKLEKGGEGE